MRSKPPIRISKGSIICIECGKEKKVGFRHKAFLCNACYLRKNHLLIRMKVLKYYGGDPPKCACCGETEYKFLAIDHINGGGLKQRRETKTHNLESWINKSKYPAGFQILCHNCNAAKGFYGECPHKTNVRN
jgi:hypothetical protein